MIRRLKKTELMRCIVMGRAMHAESRFSHLTYSDDLAGAYLSRIADDPAYIRLGAFDGEALVGMVIGSVGRYHPFSSDLISSAYLLYVDPAHRGSRAVVGLVKGFIAESRDRGAKDIVFGTSTGVKSEGFGKLMGGFGMKHVGGIYAMET